jgi:DNA repair ATPase RecN
VNYSVETTQPDFLQDAKNILLQYSGELNSLVKQKVNAIEQINQCNNHVDNDKNVIASLNEVSKAVQSQGIQLYTELLTALVVDVMDDKDQTIELDSYISRNMAQLDVVSVKGGKKQNIVNARGGSISNLVATGMRFIELVQSSNRRVLLLDEPDCWIQTSIVPRYISVIGALCEQIGVQCVFISHHTIDEIPTNCHYVELTKDHRGVVQASSKKNIESHKSVSNLQKINQKQFEDLNSHFGTEVGIKSINLFNVMSHTDTTIELHPGLTWLRGENDLGKSCINRALDAMLQNKGYDELIRDDEDIAKVTVVVEEGYKISWSYSRKNSIKSVYTLFNEDGEVEQTCESGKGVVPDFVQHYLAVTAKDGKILNITTQTDPLHLLHPNISSAKRAEMINLGCSSQKVHKMIAKHKELIAESKRSLKDNKSNLVNIDRSISKLQAVLPLLEVIGAKQEVNALKAKIDTGNNILQQMESSAASIKSADKYLIMLSDMVGSNQLSTDHGIMTLEKAFVHYNNLKNVENINADSDLKKLMQLVASNQSALEDSMGKYNLGCKVGLSLSKNNKINDYGDAIGLLKELAGNRVNIAPLEKSFAYFSKLGSLNQEIQMEEKLLAEGRAELALADQNIATLKSKYGDICSTCGQKLNHKKH